MAATVSGASEREREKQRGLIMILQPGGAWVLYVCTERTYSYVLYLFYLNSRYGARSRPPSVRPRPRRPKIK